MNVEQERQLLADVHQHGFLARLGTYFRLSGPGWLQSAITLGGGSLASSLYLGVLAGFTLLWLQPVAMILGIIMLSAIGYVTLSTGERPFRAVNEHVNPVMGWAWALASLAASIVWCLPQYSLATSVLQQNLLPDLLGKDSAMGDFNARLLIAATVLVITTLVTWSYDSGNWGIRLYELMLKIMVAMIVLCFIGVVIRMTFAEEGLRWGEVLGGFVPDFSLFREPAPGFRELLQSLSSERRMYWESRIISAQRDVLISAAATAVGINMTFLLPYTLLRRKWTKEFRGLLSFDLSTGMFVPFVLATSCVIMASASQFHPGLWPESRAMELELKALGTDYPMLSAGQAGLLASPMGAGPMLASTALFPDSYLGKAELTESETSALRSFKESRVKDRLGDEYDTKTEDEKKKLVEEEAIPHAEKRLALALVNKTALDLASSLKPLTGPFFANVIFGLGVVGMTLSTITILMLISGMVICELLNLPPVGWPHRIATLAAVTGALGPFVWAEYGFYLAIPTSVFGFTLLPIAYLTFFLLMNQRSLLGDEMPRGGKRLLWNVLMFVAAGIATVASVWVIWQKAGWYGIGGVVGLLVLALVVHFARRNKPVSSGQ